MKENYFTSLISEGGKLSHKRWISVTTGGVLLWGIVYALCTAKQASDRLAIIYATMFFIGVMAGVTTIPQLLSIWKGTPAPPEKPSTEEIKKP